MANLKWQFEDAHDTSLDIEREHGVPACRRAQAAAVGVEVKVVCQRKGTHKEIGLPPQGQCHRLAELASRPIVAASTNNGLCAPGGEQADANSEVILHPFHKLPHDHAAEEAHHVDQPRRPLCILSR